MTSPTAPAIFPDLDGASVFITCGGSGIGTALYTTGLGVAEIARRAARLVAAYDAAMR